MQPRFNSSHMPMDHTSISVQLEFHPLAAPCVVGGGKGGGGGGGCWGSDLVEAAGQQLSLFLLQSRTHEPIQFMPGSLAVRFRDSFCSFAGLQLSAIRGSGSGIRDKDCSLQPPKPFINDVIPHLAAVGKAHQ